MHLALLAAALLVAVVPAVTWTHEAPSMEEAGDLPQMTLELAGLVPPGRGREAAFLFGRLRTPARSVRAVLLRSGDGGRHWREVLPDVPDSEVLAVDFVGCEGRAWVGWTTGGPGEVLLYASTDCGASWRRRSALPKEGHTEWFAASSWQDAQHGLAWLVDTAQEAPVPRALATRDGGRTWSPRPDAPAFSPSSATARDPSGAAWRLETRDATMSVVVFRQPPGGPEVPVADIPRVWRVEDRRLEAR